MQVEAVGRDAGRVCVRRRRQMPGERGGRAGRRAGTGEREGSREWDTGGGEGQDGQDRTGQHRAVSQLGTAVGGANVLGGVGMRRRQSDVHQGCCSFPAKPGQTANTGARDSARRAGEAGASGFP